MAEKNASHIECTLSDADLFTPTFVQGDIEHGMQEEIYPITKLDDNGPVEFEYKNATDKFLDLVNSYYKMKMQITKGDGTNLGDADKATPIN